MKYALIGFILNSYSLYLLGFYFCIIDQPNQMFPRSYFIFGVICTIIFCYDVSAKLESRFLGKLCREEDNLCFVLGLCEGSGDGTRFVVDGNAFYSHHDTTLGDPECDVSTTFGNEICSSVILKTSDSLSYSLLVGFYRKNLTDAELYCQDGNGNRSNSTFLRDLPFALKRHSGVGVNYAYMENATQNGDIAFFGRCGAHDEEGSWVINDVEQSSIVNDSRPGRRGAIETYVKVMFMTLNHVRVLIAFFSAQETTDVKCILRNNTEFHAQVSWCMYVQVCSMS